MNQMRYTINHCPRIPVLVAFPINFQPEIQILRIITCLSFKVIFFTNIEYC